MAPVWQEDKCSEDILWAGVFGSVSGERAIDNEKSEGICAVMNP
jgi:hypothetical protein